MSSAVTAASSATGRSDVPAHAISTVPVPRCDLPLSQRDGARLVVIRAPGTTARTASNASGVSARHEQRLAARDDALGDGRNLGRRLAQAEDHLGESLAKLAMRVDAREAEVLERRRAQRRKDPADAADGSTSPARTSSSSC